MLMLHLTGVLSFCGMFFKQQYNTPWINAYLIEVSLIWLFITSAFMDVFN
jgi:hypothetical protein